jgi:hypothetical protein
MAKGERGGQGSRTVPVAIEEPVLVPMSDAERASSEDVTDRRYQQSRRCGRRCR